MVQIHNLAVLRAANEGKHLGAYFGSWTALNIWVTNTQTLGWIDADGKPTDHGVSIAMKLDLSSQGDGRAYMWRNASDLVVKAEQLAAAAT